jgi:hypothetical protein
MRKLLKHAQIRMVAAETLWTLTRLEILKSHDWSLPVKSLKPAVESIKKEMATNTQ